MHYFNSEEKSDKVRIVCSPEFLLAIMSVRGSVYPWAISIQKYGNLIVLDNFNENEETDKLTYLDLFTTNENTNNSMANDENKIKEFCTVATRMTKVFQELLVTDKVADYQTEEEHNPYDNNDDQEDEEK